MAFAVGGKGRHAARCSAPADGVPPGSFEGELIRRDIGGRGRRRGGGGRALNWREFVSKEATEGRPDLLKQVFILTNSCWYFLVHFMGTTTVKLYVLKTTPPFDVPITQKYDTGTCIVTNSHIQSPHEAWAPPCRRIQARAVLSPLCDHIWLLCDTYVILVLM